MLFICWVSILCQRPRPVTQRFLISNTARRLCDSTSVRTLPGARDRSLNFIRLQPKGILMKHLTITIRLARGSKPPTPPRPPHLSAGVPPSLLALSSLLTMAPETQPHRMRSPQPMQPRCISLGPTPTLKPVTVVTGMTWWVARFEPHKSTQTVGRAGVGPQWARENAQWAARARPTATTPSVPSLSSYFTPLSHHSLFKASVLPVLLIRASHSLAAPYLFSRFLS